MHTRKTSKCAKALEFSNSMHTQDYYRNAFNIQFIIRDWHKESA